MPAEDHPKFQEFEKAQVALKRAHTNFNAKRGTNGERAAQVELNKAQMAFKKISAEIKG